MDFEVGAKAPRAIRTVNSYYDLAGRLERRTDNHVGLIGQYQYLGNRVASLTYGNGHRMTRLTNDAGSPAANVPTGFDSMGRVIEHRWESGASTSGHGLGTMVMQFEYHDGTGSRTPLYDRVGNRLAEYKAHQPSRSELYRYDSASRLADPGYVAATSSSNKSFERGTLVSSRSAVNSGASPYEREGWRLDGVNNWNQYGSNTGGASIGTSIESTAFNEWNLAGATVGYAGYDNNGNAESYNYVAGASPGSYRWDPWNRLREIEDQYSQKVAEYLYDAHNRRVRKVVAYGGVENSGDVRDGTTDYAYQGWRVLWEEFTPEVMPFAPAGGPNTFVYGNYLDEVWNALETDGPEMYTNYYFLTGVNYSVMGVIDAYNTNALAEAYEYDPYGRHRVIDPGTDATYFTSDDTYDELHPGAINNAIRYTGQRFDAESGLMYYKNRYYDPAAGRFIGRDPIGWWAGANRYGYVGGRPTMGVDPEGLLTLTETEREVTGGIGGMSVSDRVSSWSAKEEIEAIRDALICFQCSGWAEDEDREYMKSLWQVIGEYERLNYNVNVTLYDSVESINYPGFYNPATGSISLYLLRYTLVEESRWVDGDSIRGRIVTDFEMVTKGDRNDLYKLLIHEGMHAIQASRPNGVLIMGDDLLGHGYYGSPHEVESRNLGEWFHYIALPCTTDPEFPRPRRYNFEPEQPGPKFFAPRDEHDAFLRRMQMETFP